MGHNQTQLDYCLEAMGAAGAQKSSATLELTQKHELNTESGQVKLLRSNAEATLRLTFIKDQKKASTSLNKLTKAEIDSAVARMVVQAQSAPADEANDVAGPDNQGQTQFTHGVQAPDLDGLYDLLHQFNGDVVAKYPKISGDAILSYDSRVRHMATSKGVRLTEHRGNYNFQMLFGAKEGDKITSFNFTGSSLIDLTQNLMDVGMTGELLKQAEAELEAKPLQAKFMGDVIIAPLCGSVLLSMVAGIALSDSALISGTSVLKEKIGERVASDKLTWSSSPRSQELAGGYALTSDGFVAADIPVIEAGVLKNHLLTLYGANKTGGKRAGSYGDAMIIEAGDTALADMIKGVERGILLSRFSGGNPGANGEFAGVAKNSFYIENGVIQFPITETMVSGNLFDLLANIENISSERVNFGSALVPWIHAKGVTISG